MIKETVTSPCINVCSIDEDTGFCRGCYRTLDEVTQWLKLSDKERQTICETLPLRREAYPDISAR